IRGLPRPAAIKTEAVPRVPWSPVLETVWVAKRQLSATFFQAWRRSGNELFILARSRLKQQVHLLSKPDGLPERLTTAPGSPRQVVVNPQPDKNYFVFGMDSGRGDEFYQLYRYNLLQRTSHLLTDGKSRNLAGSFDPRGQRFLYTS